MTDYDKVKQLNLRSPAQRWEQGIPHHPQSVRLMQFLSAYDYTHSDDYFSWKTGGDGDNGEELQYQLDAYFEMLDYYAQSGISQRGRY